MGDLIAVHFSRRRFVKKQDPEMTRDAALLHIKKAQALLMRLPGQHKEQAWALEDLAISIQGQKKSARKQVE